MMVSTHLTFCVCISIYVDVTICDMAIALVVVQLGSFDYYNVNGIDSTIKASIMYSILNVKHNKKYKGCRTYNYFSKCAH